MSTKLFVVFILCVVAIAYTNAASPAVTATKNEGPADTATITPTKVYTHPPATTSPTPGGSATSLTASFMLVVSALALFF